MIWLCSLGRVAQNHKVFCQSWRWPLLFLMSTNRLNNIYYLNTQFKKISLFEFPATAFFKLQGDLWLILASPSKLYPYDQQGGAI